MTKQSSAATTLLQSRRVPLTFGSLFAGIGGFDLGLERSGMICKWQVEIDEYATAILERHWPDVPRWGDVRTWPQSDTERVDCICGGFPCQDISRGGNRKERTGIDGRQSGLWAEFARIICDLRPRFVLVENVADVRVRGIDRILGDLSESGYDAEWETIPASSVGAPQERERVFFVAYPRGERVERLLTGEIPRFAEFSWSEGVRSAAELRGRSDVPEPVVCGIDDGFSVLVERLTGLGNAIVPQVAEWIGRRIAEAV